MQLTDKSRDVLHDHLGELEDAELAAALREALAICEAKALPSVQAREITQEIEDLKAQIRSGTRALTERGTQLTRAEAQRDLLKELVKDLINDRGCRY